MYESIESIEIQDLEFGREFGKLANMGE